MNLIVVGGGEFARVVIEAARGVGSVKVIGFVDPKPCEETVQRLGVARLGDDSAIAKFEDARLILGIGSLKVSPARGNIVGRLGYAADRWTSLVDRAATVSPTARLGRGALVLPGAVISSGATIGDHAIVNLGAKVDHDVKVGNFVHLCPQCALGGGSTVGDGCFIGMGAMVRDHTEVAPDTTVGMGAIVTKTFSAGATLVGMPAHPLDQKPRPR